MDTDLFWNVELALKILLIAQSGEIILEMSNINDPWKYKITTPIYFGSKDTWRLEHPCEAKLQNVPTTHRAIVQNRCTEAQDDEDTSADLVEAGRTKLS